MADLPFNLSPEELQDVSPALTIMIKMARGNVEIAENALCGNLCKDYGEYLQRYHKLKAYEAVLGELTNLKDQGKDQLK